VRAADHVGRFPLDHDPGVSCIAHTAWTLSALGYPERAAQRMRECVDRARTLDHPVTFAMALNFAIIFHHDQGDREQVQELEDLRFTFATEHGFALFLGLGEVFRGWLQVEAGHGDEGLARIRRGLAAYAGVGAVLGTPTFLATLARVCERLGRVEEGLAAVAEAEALSERTGMTYWDAEIQRLRGTLLLRSDAESQTAAAESCFLRALAIARRQDAKAFELRAATSLARLWQRQRKRMQARALLSEVYDWFTEGFATPDLVAAQTLLEGFDRRARR
jgi:predicted ATPase